MRGLKIIGAILGVLLVIWAIGFTAGWFMTGAAVVSPENVKAQHEQVIGKYEAMIAAAGNACTVQQSQPEGSDKSPTLVEKPVLAYAATFRSIAASYNSSVDNLFKAGIVAPPGYPKSVDIKALDTSDWCTVPDQLAALK
jgi:hypothetical protein